MKIRGKNPTCRQKLAIMAAALNPENWLVTSFTTRELNLQHRNSGKTRIIPA